VRLLQILRPHNSPKKISHENLAKSVLLQFRVPIFFLSKKLGLTVFSILSNLIGGSGAKLQKEIIPKTTFFLPIVSSYEDESLRRICFPKATFAPLDCFPYEHCKKSSFKKVI